MASLVRERDDAHCLWEIRVARCPHEHAVRFATGFLGIWSKPRPGAVTIAEGPRLHACRIDHRALLAAFATHPDLGQIPAGAPLVNPELLATRGGRRVDE